MGEQHVYRAGSGEYLGPLRDSYSQGKRPDGSAWPDCLLYAAQGCNGQLVGINADLAELRDAPPGKRKGRGQVIMAEKLTDWLRAKFGDGWVLAPRLTARLRDRGYTRAVSSTAYNRECMAWARQRAAVNPDIAAAARVLADHHAAEAARILARKG